MSMDKFVGLMFGICLACIATLMLMLTAAAGVFLFSALGGV